MKLESRLVHRAHQFLLRQAHPILMGEVCDGLGISRGMSFSLTQKLRQHLGADLIADERRRAGQVRKYTYFSVVGATLLPERRQRFTFFDPPADLWRAWVNPETGIAAPRLGLDPANEQ